MQKSDIIGHTTTKTYTGIDLRGVDLSAMLNAGLIGGILAGSIAVLGAFYYYTETKNVEKEAIQKEMYTEMQAQLLARLDAKDEQMLDRLGAKDEQMLARLDTKDDQMRANNEQMLARLDAKDVRFEAFVERVLAATRPAI